jgi:benzil reductase ((S)-benzoin forming)
MQPPPVEHLFLITGTTRGIGKALVETALKIPGSFVVSFSRSENFLDESRQNVFVELNTIETIGPAFDALRYDSSRSDGLKNTVLINNAGVLEPIAPLGDCDVEELDRNIHVNLTAPLVLTRHFYQFSKSLPGSKWIINITSGASRAPYYGWSAYGAAKAGLDMATRAMALEFARIDPTFNACAVAPGTVDTNMQARIRQCTPKQFERVDKFFQLKAKGELYPPQRPAAALIRFLLEGQFENGGRYDLREMGI